MPKRTLRQFTLAEDNPADLSAQRIGSVIEFTRRRKGRGKSSIEIRSSQLESAKGVLR